ncbi:hypothetical protein Fmac_012896 [Flemingia macrophylla]|uniref:DDE Tnp4 domain-containing protein n=1 Tax=Flemingia macrophylla TaxID=520843 RepID=A0ABD1MTU7_9FABA
MRSVRDALRRLRATWRLLAISRKWKRECVEYMPFVVVAGCLLHNFLVECDEVMELKDGEEVACVEKYVPFDGVGDESAVRVRDALALHLIIKAPTFVETASHPLGRKCTLVIDQ